MITGDAMDAMLDAAALASKEEDAMDAMLDAAALSRASSKEEDAEMTTGTCAARDCILFFAVKLKTRGVETRKLQIKSKLRRTRIVL